MAVVPALPTALVPAPAPAAVPLPAVTLPLLPPILTASVTTFSTLLARGTVMLLVSFLYNTYLWLQS